MGERTTADSEEVDESSHLASLATIRPVAPDPRQFASPTGEISSTRTSGSGQSSRTLDRDHPKVRENGVIILATFTMSLSFSDCQLILVSLFQIALHRSNVQRMPFVSRAFSSLSSLDIELSCAHKTTASFINRASAYATPPLGPFSLGKRRCKIVSLVFVKATHALLCARVVVRR